MEWSLALVSEAGRAREAIRIVGPGAEDMIGLLRRDIGVDYSLSFRGVSGGSSDVEPADIRIRDRRLTGGHHRQRGHLSLGTEPAPETFVALGERYGNGFRFAAEAGVVVTDLPFPQARPESGDTNG